MNNLIKCPERVRFMKRKVAIMLSVALSVTVASTSVAYADEAVVPSYTAPIVEDLAVDYNKELKVIEDTFNEADNDYKLAQRIAVAVSDEDFDEDDYTENEIEEDELRYELSAQKKLYPLTTFNAMWDAKLNYLNKVNDLEVEANNLVYSYMNQVRRLENSQNYVDLTSEKLKVKKSELELGLVTANDVSQYEKMYWEAVKDLSEAQNELEETTHKINILVGDDIKSDFRVQVMDVPMLAYEIEDLESVLNTMLENSYQIEILEQEKEYTETERALKNRYSGYSSYKLELEQMENTIDELEFKIDNAKNQVAFDLYSKTNNMAKNQLALDNAKLDQQIATNNLNVAKAKFEAGLLSELDYMDSQKEYNDAWIAYRDAQLTYHIAYLEYVNFIEMNTMELGAATTY